jgi:hypothetical protein
VIIWPDADKPGFDYANKVAQHLMSLGCTVKGVNPPEEAKAGWDAADCIADGRDPFGFIDTAFVWSKTKPVTYFPFLTVDELENFEPPAMLVDGVLTEGGLSVLWGSPGSLKTFVALDIALCISTGFPWHGRSIKQGIVVFIAAEGQFGIGRRITAWRQVNREKKLPKPKLLVVPRSFSLMDDIDKLINDILIVHEERPVLIVLDTLARTIGAGNENATPDMNAYVTASDRLREATGANCLIIHHSGVHEQNRERGSNALRGAADTIIAVKRQGDKLDLINRAPQGKQKDLEEFATIKMEARKVYYPIKDDKEDFTLALVLRDEDDDEEAESAKLGKNEKAILSLLIKAGKPLSTTHLQKNTGITHKSNFNRLLQRLRDKGLIESKDDINSLTDKGKNAI